MNPAEACLQNFDKKIVIGRATLYCGNCHYLLPSLYGQVDADITEPPYGANTNVKNTASNRELRRHGLKSITPIAKDWNKVKGDEKPFGPSPFLVFPKTVLWGANRYCYLLPGNTKWIIWSKSEHTISADNTDCEIAWANLNGPSRIYQHSWRGNCDVEKKNINQRTILHPHQKPVNLGKFSINECRLEPDPLIADFFAGSGSFVVAALQMGHRVIAVEKHPPWFDILCDRADDAQRQTSPAL